MSYREKQPLFSESELDAVFRAQVASVRDRVDGISRDQFLATPEDTLLEHIRSSMEVEPIQLHEDAMAMDQQETKIDVSGWPNRNVFRERGPIYVAGIQVTVTIPFSGDPNLWKLRPNPCVMSFPRGIVHTPGANGLGHLDMVFSQPSDQSPDALKQELDKSLRDIRSHLEHQQRQIEQHNAALPNVIRQAVQARRARLQTHDGIAQALNIPLKRRDGVPEIRPIPVQRKLVRPLPPPPKSGYKPEPGITDDDYEHILSVIRHEGRTFEATPVTFSSLDEEQLRDIILAHLNGHYQGGATGETFRRSGKTDVRIEDNNRAAFVAECKVWRGSKELTDAVGQLLSYLTWRDCKAAIVIFNKHNAGFSELLQKVPETLAAHPLVRKKPGQRTDGEWRFVFTSTEDEAREVTVHVFLFNLYVKDKTVRAAVEAVGQGG
jgi:hypothetical protein